jgi:hypothetical protein
MARALKFCHADSTLPYEIGAKVDKKALYGHARRIAEKDGKALSRGLLLSFGRLLPSNAVSSVKVDPLGSPVDPVECYLDDAIAEVKPSSFDVELPLTPVPMTALAAFQVSDVYPLVGEGLGVGLYRTEFNYRKSVAPKDALLLVRADGAFLLVGAAKRSTFVDLSVAYDFFDTEGEADDADDDLDFSMI